MIGFADMGADEVHTVLAALAAVGCRAWIGGGWGVDALVGHQTRAHRDLDLAVAAEHEAAALRALGRLGCVVETDWRPVRVEVVAEGRGPLLRTVRGGPRPEPDPSSGPVAGASGAQAGVRTSHPKPTTSR
ncbi:nucleotidyltransferase domain-containing protein [Micromonospora sp. URMC 107]|uniref:nucleotidyltransferase domain-containing protein n=1 Tax=Micromonospora sp. URMC 107 TaxID=3423418 RepID=UPI003F1BA338